MVLVGIVGIQNSDIWSGWFSEQNYINPEYLAEARETEVNWGIFNNQLLNVPLLEPRVLGETQEAVTDNKRILVNLTDQTLTAYEDGNAIFGYSISSGKWNRTPTGVFKVWAKIRSQKMSGGSKELGTYYYLPNVPYILFFYNDKVAKKVGYSIHGTYWHDNFGVPMSHGCINMRTSEAGNIFGWATVGTEIEIVGKYQPKLAVK
jgi:hypothetical protein